MVSVHRAAISSVVATVSVLRVVMVSVHRVAISSVAAMASVRRVVIVSAQPTMIPMQSIL